jgi:hypothetical protein
MARTGFGTQHHIEMIGAPVLAVAGAAAQLASKIKRARPRPKRGVTLRVGPETPLWNKLAATAAKLLQKRGDKAHLARVLGISRQRLHLLLTAKSACPDAERALLLIEWVEARKRGQNLA